MDWFSRKQSRNATVARAERISLKRSRFSKKVINRLLQEHGWLSFLILPLMIVACFPNSTGLGRIPPSISNNESGLVFSEPGLSYDCCGGGADFLVFGICLFVPYGHHQSTKRRKRMEIFSHTSSDHPVSPFPDRETSFVEKK